MRKYNFFWLEGGNYIAPRRKMFKYGTVHPKNEEAYYFEFQRRARTGICGSTKIDYFFCLYKVFIDYIPKIK